MGKKPGYNERNEDKKRVLWQQLEQQGCLWSYAKNPSSIDDSLLIEKALLYLEFEDLHKLSAQTVKNDASCTHLSFLPK